MENNNVLLANWGNFPKIQAHVCTPQTEQEACQWVTQTPHLIARGNGRCYGDAALAPQVLSTLCLNNIRSFDAQTGVVECEAGVLLQDIIRLTVPQGWFFHVTPGIKAITVGGAIASDVHGKNHPDKGCFSNWLISFELLRSDGSVIHCSKTENTALFWQTCGGMGWTGVVLSARFQLMPIQSVYMQQTSVRAGSLEEVFRAFETHRNLPYAAGWVDCLAGGRAFGRGVVFFARHDEQPGPLEYPVKKLSNVPFYAPSWILNKLSIWMHNQIIFARAQTGEQQVDMDTYFYPLDRVQHWNRLYGRRGFVQYQFCLPEERSFDGIADILHNIKKSGDTPFLTVLKRHGERPAEAVHSFPIRGYSLALDFPRTRSLPQLISRLDELVWQYGGKIYLTKDACSHGKMGRIDPGAFGEEKFQSLLKQRILDTLV